MMGWLILIILIIAVLATVFGRRHGGYYRSGYAPRRRYYIQRPLRHRVPRPPRPHRAPRPGGRGRGRRRR